MTRDDDTPSRPEPGADTFTDEDLEPGPAEHRGPWRNRADGLAAMVAVGAAGLWAGGEVALSLSVRPALGTSLPASMADAALSAAHNGFAGVAIGCAAVLLGCEVARTIVGLRRSRRPAARIRRMTTLLLGALAAYIALILAPGITHLRSAGVGRTSGEAGAELDRLEQRAELVRHTTVPLGALLISLHIATLRLRRTDDDEPEAPVGPRPPGPA